MIWRVPGVTKPGHVSDHLVDNVDLAPTITALCGVPAMETADGHDIANLLRGGDHAVQDVAVTEAPWSKAVRWGHWRLVHYQRAMFGGKDVGELYQMDDDPHETRNLDHDASYRPVVEECRRLLLEWLIGTTRIRTAAPPYATESRAQIYVTAGDGKESNTDGPHAASATTQSTKS